VFFGSTSPLLEKVRSRLEHEPPLRYLVIDLARVSGVDSSAVAAFGKVLRLATSHGFEVVLTGASEPVLAQLHRAGIAAAPGIVSFEPDLDRGLQRCEDALLQGVVPGDQADGAGSLPKGLSPYLERVELARGQVLLHQDEPAGDVYVLEHGRLGIETRTAEGARVRVRSVRPGVVVGEVALYTGVPRTADVVAETDCVLLRFGAEALSRMEAEDPAVAAAWHRFLAGTLAERLSDTMKTFDALLD
jgi:SulP family sulfate permease